MKKYILFVIPVLFSSLSLFAQDKRDTIHSISRNATITSKEKRAAMMDSLDLTKEQEKKMKAVNKELRADMKEIKDNTQLSKDERKTKTRELVLKHQNELSKILSPEQLTKYKQLLKERKEKPAGLRMDEDN